MITISIIIICLNIAKDGRVIEGKEIPMDARTSP